MDKIVNGITYEKAKFLRTTCKACGKDLPHCHIMNGYGWCNKVCKKAWLRRPHRSHRHRIRFGVAFDCEGNSI